MEPTKTRVCTCIKCNKKHTLTAKQHQWDSWKAGELVQNAFPNFTSSQRELLISGICGDCFDKMFP